jgi:hypothetical protein
VTPEPPVAIPTPSTTTAANTGPRPDAILFLPGMGGEQSVSVNQSVQEIASQLRAAYARQDVTAVFTVESDDAKKRARILRRPTAGGDAANFVDVYTVDYQSVLTRQFESRRDLMKMLLLFLLTIGSGVRFIGSVLGGWRGKTIREKVQFLMLGVLLSLFWWYLGILGFAVFDQVNPYVPKSTTHKPSDVPERVKPIEVKPVPEKDKKPDNSWMSTLVVLLALLGLTIPPDWKAQFGRLMGATTQPTSASTTVAQKHWSACSKAEWRR